MKKVLGIDVGVGSIGWAYVLESNTPGEKGRIVKAGVKVIPLDTDTKKEFVEGSALSANKKRTLQRGARRNLQRYRLRKKMLIAALTEAGMMPSKDHPLWSLHREALFGLRAKGLEERLTLEELGRVFFHLNQRRGYQSNRKTRSSESNEEKTESSGGEETDYLGLIASRERLLKTKGWTIGQYFFHHLKNEPGFRVKTQVFLRQTYIAEFDALWKAQEKFYPETLTAGLFNRIRNQILYYQRRLKSQKKRVAKCRFEPRLRVAPRSSPLFQVFRIWQDVNHLEIRGKDGSRHGLTSEQRKDLIHRLQDQGKMSQSKVLKSVGFKNTRDYYLNLDRDLEGNSTRSQLLTALDGWAEMPADFLDFPLEVAAGERVNASTAELLPEVALSYEKSNLFQLWHLIYSAESDEKLGVKLAERWPAIPRDCIERLCGLDFTRQGFSSLSTRAMRLILPGLQQGMPYSGACEAAGYKHSDSLTIEENELRELLDQMPLVPKNSLRSPVGERILNHLANLVNSILAHPELGRPDEVRIELARELKQNAKRRKMAHSQIKANQKKNEEIRSRLMKEFNLARVSLADIEKYKLWEECKEQSPYEPGKMIKLTDLFSGSYDVDHIIPQSRLFDDSLANKTIARRELNARKGQQTALEFMESLGEQRLNEYKEFVRTLSEAKDGISGAKRDKLLMRSEDIPDDFIARQLKLTQFIAREAMTRLQAVVRTVTATSGAVTEHLRHQWGLDDILKNLNWETYDKLGQTRVETSATGQVLRRIEGWSKRDDHRHHAVDALAVACTRPAYIQRLNRLNQEYVSYRENEESARKFPLPWPQFVQEAQQAIAAVLVVYKSGKRVASYKLNKIKTPEQIHVQKTLVPRGPLHQESVYGKIKVLEKVALSPTFALMDQVAYAHTRQALQERLARYDHNARKAFKDQPNDPVPRKLKEVYVWVEKFVYKYKLDAGFKVADAKFIVDPEVKEKVLARLAAFDNNPKKAFASLDQNPIWLNEKAGIRITAVRCFTGGSNLTAVHLDEDGYPRDYVVKGNNHHVAIYRSHEGKLMETVVSFWEAVKRKMAGLPIVIKDPKRFWNSVLEKGIEVEEFAEHLPPDGAELVATLQENEVFAWGIDRNELERLVLEKNYAGLSKHLYRVQSKSAGDYFLRKIEVTHSEKDAAASGAKIYIRIQSLSKFTGIKVRLNQTGEIIQIGET